MKPDPTPPLDDIQRLLALDPSVPNEAMRLRIGIAKLAGWTETSGLGGSMEVNNPDGDRVGIYTPNRWSPHKDLAAAVRYYPHFESRLDAAVTLPIGEAERWEFSIGSDGHTLAAIASVITIKEMVNESLPFERAERPAWAAYCAWLAYQQRISARRERSASGGK